MSDTAESIEPGAQSARRPRKHFSLPPEVPNRTVSTPLRAHIMRMGQWKSTCAVALVSTLTATLLALLLGILVGWRGTVLVQAGVIAALTTCVIAGVACSIVIKLIFEVESLRKESAHQASHDELTRVFNRRYFLKRLDTEMIRSVRSEEPLTLLLLDIDHFKQFNDSHGHAIGDRVLRKVAAHCASLVRPYDTFARYGGEEFVCIFPGLDLDHAESVAERMRRSLETLSIDMKDGTSARVTISVGLGERKKKESSLSLLQRTDEALYQAKHRGRNRVIAVR
jgi:diguanylate cyclase (GGDEF)-like protein